MSKIRAISICWLCFMAAFILGLYVYHTKIWPYTLLQNIKNFVVGEVAEHSSLFEKIENDLNFRPSRHIKSHSRKNSPIDDSKSKLFLKMDPAYLNKDDLALNNYQEIKGLKLNSRRVNPKMFLSPKAPSGYRLIYGTFDFRKRLHGAILIDPSGHLANVWRISQEEVEWEHQKDSNVFPHGIEIAPDGSIVTIYDNGSSMTKYDYCGKVIWRIKGRFHHSISFENDSVIWALTFVGEKGAGIADSLIRIDYETGEILKIIQIKEIMDANPDIDIFGIKQTDTAEGSRWLPSPWHSNDVEALPKQFEKYYQGFDAGDLLISLRSPNLIFAMNSDTLKVKWWRTGLTRRQHDPDWNDKGTITIFNNNMHRGYSNIIELDPYTYDHNIMVDGEEYGFYTWWRGKHQLLPNGGVLITSPDQGRVFEVDSRGNITFEFLNTYSDKGEYLSLSEAKFLSTNFFKGTMQCK